MMMKKNGIEITAHINGPWNIENGLFINKYGACTNNPAIYYDTETGTLLKAGDIEMVKQYMNTHINKLLDLGFTTMAMGTTMIEFNRYENAKLTSDEICTILNYMNNCPSAAQVKQLFSMKETELKEKLQTLYEIGF